MAYLVDEEDTVQNNVGGTDRIARLVVGPVLILAGIVGYAGLLALTVGPLPQTLASVVVVLTGTILLVTGIVQKCPLNQLLGFNIFRRTDTRDRKDRQLLTRSDRVHFSSGHTAQR